MLAITRASISAYQPSVSPDAVRRPAALHPGDADMGSPLTSPTPVPNGLPPTTHLRDDRPEVVGRRLLAVVPADHFEHHLTARHELARSERERGCGRPFLEPVWGPCAVCWQAMSPRAWQEDLRTRVSVAAGEWGEVRESNPDEADRRRVALEKAIRAAYDGGIEVDDIVSLTASRHDAGALTPEQVVSILV